MKPVHKTITNKREVVEMLSGVVHGLIKQGHTRADLIAIFGECLYGVAGGFESDGMEVHIFKEPSGVMGIKVTQVPMIDCGVPS